MLQKENQAMLRERQPGQPAPPEHSKNVPARETSLQGLRLRESPQAMRQKKSNKKPEA
jgi:hypothetical protein